jgi:Gas vesicle protein
LNDGSSEPPATRQVGLNNRRLAGQAQPSNLADLLERVLDKGIVVAGDITLALGSVDILTLKIRLLIASVDKAQEIGINWWQSDPYLSSNARVLTEERDRLLERVNRLEERLGMQVDERQGQPDDTGPDSSTPRTG